MQGRDLRLRLQGTAGFVLVAFLLRLVFSTMNAVAFQLRNTNTLCPDGPCGACQNAYYHITQWASYTPQFQLTVVLVSSPVALLVALWGMTSTSTLQTMTLTQRELQSTPLRNENSNNVGRRKLPIDFF